jgi:hypothetical protein
MDNKRIDITYEGDKALESAIGLVWPHPNSRATHFFVANYKLEVTYHSYGTDGKATSTSHSENLRVSPDGTETLILFWRDEGAAIPLPFPMVLSDAINFVKGWLRTRELVDEPDHDGSNGKGWRVFTEAWGHVAGFHYAICGIQPAWAMYGK